MFHMFEVSDNMRQLCTKLPVIYLYDRVSGYKCIMLQDATGKELQRAISTKPLLHQQKWDHGPSPTNHDVLGLRFQGFIVLGFRVHPNKTIILH